MDRKVFMAFLLSLVVVGLIVLTFAIFRPFLLALLWAAVLSTVSFRLYERICAWLKGRRTAAAFLMTFLMFLLVVVPIVLLGLVIVQEAQVIVESRSWGSGLESLEERPWVQEALAFLGGLTPEDRPLHLRDLLRGLVAAVVSPQVVGGAAAVVGDIVAYVGGLLANVFFILLALFYFYRDGPALLTVLRELIPLRDEDRATLLQEMKNAVEAAVHGGLVTALVQGALGFVILVILGVKQALLVATVMAVASLIPVVGTAIVWVPMALYFLADDQLVKGLVLAGYGTLVISTSDNLIRPLLVGRHMRAHPLLLFFGILGGIAMFGFAGIVLGPVVVAFLQGSARLFRREFREPSPQAPAGGS